MGTTIVVGMDGSEASRRALIWATRRAAGIGAVVVPVMTWQYPTSALLPYPFGSVVPPADTMQAEAEIGLAAMVAELGDAVHPDAEIAEARVIQGSPGETLSSLAADGDLLVLGSRGLGGFAGLIMGSVSTHCANHSPCPVAIVPATWDPDAPPTGTVLVAVDGSAHANEAVSWADRWADPGDVIQLQHFWNLPVTALPTSMDVDPQLLVEAAEALIDQAALLVSDHEAVTRVTRADARSALTEMAADFDLCVLGAKGQGAIGRLFLGSVATYMTHHVVTPTVFVK